MNHIIDRQDCMHDPLNLTNASSAFISLNANRGIEALLYQAKFSAYRRLNAVRVFTSLDEAAVLIIGLYSMVLLCADKNLIFKCHLS